MYAYCANNDILIKATSMKKAKEYALHRLSPAYGYAPGRAKNLALNQVSAARAEDLEGSSITWEVE